MDLRALGCQRVAWQHCVVLPAVQATDPSVGPPVSSQAHGIAIAPHRAFVEGRLDLAVAAENPAFTADEQQRAIDRATAGRVAFGDTDHDVDAGILRRFAQPVSYRPGNLHGVGEIFRHRLKGQLRGRCMGEERIAGKPGLAERRDGRTHRTGLADQPAGLFRRSLAVERHGGSLDRSEFETRIVGHQDSSAPLRAAASAPSSNSSALTRRRRARRSSPTLRSCSPAIKAWISGNGRMTPRPPHCPSGISVGNTQTRGATSSYFPPSARTTASVTSLTSDFREASVYWPSGTV